MSTTWLSRARSAVVVAVAAVLVLMTSTPAAAHVLLATAQPNGDGTTTLTFTFDHGCGESPTTVLTVSLPSGVTAAPTTTQPPGWTAQVTAGQVSWTGPGITPGVEAAFTMLTRIVAPIGTALQFPTLQRCASGESYEWYDEQPGDEHPAPTLITTAAVLAETPPRAQPVAAQKATGATRAQSLGAVAGLVCVAVLLGVFLTRRRPTAP